MGLGLAGPAPARLAGTLGIAVHPAMVLRLVAAAPAPQVSAAPEVLGVDDFALAKGEMYGDQASALRMELARFIHRGAARAHRAVAVGHL